MLEYSKQLFLMSESLFRIPNLIMLDFQNKLFLISKSPILDSEVTCIFAIRINFSYVKKLLYVLEHVLDN